MMSTRKQSADILRIPLSRLERGDVEAQGEVSAEELESDVPEISPDTTFALEYRAYSLGREKMVQGVLSGTFEPACSRCLKPFPLSVRIEFRHCYVPGLADTPFESPEDGDYYFTQTGDYLEIKSGLREEILLQVPLKPLPAQDADGRCRHCGKLPEEILGEPEVEEVDPRMAVLKELLDKEDKG